MPYATMEASPRNSSASTETKKSVEESTLDYGVMTKIPDVHESSKLRFEHDRVMKKREQGDQFALRWLWLPNLGSVHPAGYAVGSI